MGKLQSVARTIYRIPLTQAVIQLGARLARRDRRMIRRYFSNPGPRGLHIGAGCNILDGWLNTNYPNRSWSGRAIAMDATIRFPMPDNAFDFIFSEHMIEHVPYSDGISFLRESFRVLKPGGRIRISTPDIRFLVDLLGSDLRKVQKDYIAWASERFLRNGEPHTALSVVNNFVRDWGHTYIYDRSTLETALTQVGFVAVTSVRVNESDQPWLQGIDNPERFPGDYLELESMIYQAKKPG